MLLIARTSWSFAMRRPYTRSAPAGSFSPPGGVTRPDHPPQGGGPCRSLLRSGRELDHEEILARGGDRSVSDIDAAREAPRREDVSRGGEGDALRALVRGVPEALGPERAAARVELGDERVEVAGAGELRAAEVEDAREVAGDRDLAGRADGDGVRVLRAVVAEARAPDRRPVAVERRDED